MLYNNGPSIPIYAGMLKEVKKDFKPREELPGWNGRSYAADESASGSKAPTRQQQQQQEPQPSTSKGKGAGKGTSGGAPAKGGAKGGAQGHGSGSAKGSQSPQVALSAGKTPTKKPASKQQQQQQQQKQQQSQHQPPATSKRPRAESNVSTGSLSGATPHKGAKGSVFQRLGKKPGDFDNFKIPKASSSNRTPNPPKGNNTEPMEEDNTGEADVLDVFVREDERFEEAEGGARVPEPAAPAGSQPGPVQAGTSAQQQSDVGAGAEERGEDDTNLKQAKPPGKFRVIVTAGKNGETAVTKPYWDKFKPRFSGVVQQQQDNLTEPPILLREFWFHGGRIIVEPWNKYSQEKIMDIINNDIKVNNTDFYATTPAKQSPTATVVFRITGAGKVDDLMNAPGSGLIRLNGWDIADVDRKIVILMVNGKDGGVRHIRAACSEPVIKAIQENDNGLNPGEVFCGRGIATVQYKRQDLTKDVQVTFTRQ